jgi:hypothetical protein
MAKSEDNTERERHLARERSRRWREAHPDKAAEHTRAWYMANRNEILERVRTRRAANPEKTRRDAAKAKAIQKSAHPERYAYQGQKDSAKRRNIPFVLTFEEWWLVWESSGKWQERGLGSDQYCMARFGDTGAYEIGNVRIITGSENRAEARKGKTLSEVHRKALIEAWKKRRHRRPAFLTSKRSLPTPNG